jgi:predicted ATPase
MTDVVIEGLRGVGRVELRFDPKQRVFTLFGVNGVGKTKCLEALYQFLLAANKDFVQKGLPSENNARAIMAKIQATVNGETLELRNSKTDNAENYLFGTLKESCLHSLPVVFLGAGSRANMAKSSQDATQEPLGVFEKRQEKYFRMILSAFRQENLTLYNLGMSDDTRAWFAKRAKADNRNNINRGKWKAETDAVLSILHEIEPRIDLNGFQNADGEKISFRIDEEDGVFLCVEGQSRELGELSSGFAALVKMVQAIIAGYAAFTNEEHLQNVRGIVLIDEIDSHLHVEWQVKIIPLLKKLLPNTTFYIATHSPLVLAQLKKGEGYLLERHNDGVVRSKEIGVLSRRVFADMLEDAFGVNLNKLKRELLEFDDQTDAKQGLLSLLDQLEEQEKAVS